MDRAAPLGRLTWRPATVASTRVETSRARTLLLDAPGWPGHSPGQHVEVRLTADDGYQAVRSYSISGPAPPDQVAITVERLEDGEVSPYLVDDARRGDALELRGPIGGHFVWHATLGGPLTLVAGGSGVVPLAAMIRERDGVPVSLLCSARSPGEAIFRLELERLAGADPSFRLAYTFTREAPHGWTGFRRRVDVPMLREVAWPAQDAPLAFVCGPTGFVEAAAAGLLELGYDAARIRTERFGPTGPSTDRRRPPRPAPSRSATATRSRRRARPARRVSLFDRVLETLREHA